MLGGLAAKIPSRALAGMEIKEDSIPCSEFGVFPVVQHGNAGFPLRPAWATCRTDPISMVGLCCVVDRGSCKPEACSFSLASGLEAGIPAVSTSPIHSSLLIVAASPFGLLGVVLCLPRFFPMQSGVVFVVVVLFAHTRRRLLP